MRFPYTDMTRAARIVRTFKRGEHTRAQLCDAFKISEHVLRKILHAEGVRGKGAHVFYRNKRIKELYLQGASVEELMERFDLSRYNVSDRVLVGMKRDRKAQLDSWKYVDHICIVCGGVYHTGSPSKSLRQFTCSRDCGRKKGFLDKCQRYLDIRAMVRGGKTCKETAEALSLPQGTIEGPLPGSKCPYQKELQAIEVLNRHNGRSWSSPMAQLESRRARKCLEDAKLYKPLRRRGLLKTD